MPMFLLSMQVMKTVNDLIRVPELNQTMQLMSREMMKAGLIEETMGEMMDDVLDTDDIEDDADAEVDKVSQTLSSVPFRQTTLLVASSSMSSMFWFIEMS